MKKIIKTHSIREGMLLGSHTITRLAIYSYLPITVLNITLENYQKSFSARKKLVLNWTFKNNKKMC